MRIKTIELHNFGSYAGHNSFNFESMSPEERVVVKKAVIDDSLTTQGD